jgi:hypothetical protein
VDFLARRVVPDHPARWGMVGTCREGVRPYRRSKKWMSIEARPSWSALLLLCSASSVVSPSTLNTGYLPRRLEDLISCLILWSWII